MRPEMYTAFNKKFKNINLQGFFDGWKELRHNLNLKGILAECCYIQGNIYRMPKLL